MDKVLSILFVPRIEKQMVRFGIVGILNFIVSFTVFYIVYHFIKFSNVYQLSETGIFFNEILLNLHIESFEAAFANICSYCAGLSTSFLCNRMWTFQNQYSPSKQFAKFVIVNMVCLAVSTLGIFICIDILEYYYLIAWFIIMTIITIMNYLGYKYWVFKKKK